MTRSTLSAEIAGDPEEVDVLVDALSPEHAEDFPGVDTELERTGPETARLTLSSARLSQLRAAANAHLRWVRTVEDTLAAGPADDAEVTPHE